MLNKWKTPYPKELWILAIGTVINMTGSSFLWPLNTIYITQVLGRPVSVAGLVLMGYAGFGILGSLLGGYLHDRIGGKRTLLIGTFLASGCVFGLALYREWIVYIIIMGFLGFSNGINAPALYALCKGLWPEGGRRAFNLLYVSQNLGVAIGSAIGGVIAQASFTSVFVINGLSFAVFFAIVAWGLPQKRKADLEEALTGETRADSDRRAPFIIKSSIPSLLILCFGFMTCWLTYVQWSTIIPAYMYRSGLSISSYSLLWTINGLLILTAQPVSSYLTRRILPTLKSQMVTGVVLFMLSMLMLSLDSSYSGFVIGMIVITCGEIFIWPAVPAAAAELAPKGKNGMYQGLVNGFSTAGRMVGPLFGGLLYDTFNVRIMLYGLIGICLVGLVCFWGYDQIRNKQFKSG